MLRQTTGNGGSRPYPLKIADIRGGDKNWIYLFTHCLECTQLPSPVYDWDDGHGSLQDYVQEQKRVDKEMKWTFVVSFIIHLLMITPMIILGKSGIQLHS